MGRTLELWYGKLNSDFTIKNETNVTTKVKLRPKELVENLLLVIKNVMNVRIKGHNYSKVIFSYQKSPSSAAGLDFVRVIL